MPSKDESKFRELLGELNFFNKLASKGKGLFTQREKAVTHPDDCKCKECSSARDKEQINLYFFNRGDFKR